MKRFLNVFFLLVIPLSIVAHNGWEKHVNEMRGVLGLRKEKRVDDWAKFISSEMIDKMDFHRRLDYEYSLSLGNPHRHRMLFHWPYDAEPWNKDLERHIRDRCKTEMGADDTVRIVKELIRIEQKRRNKKINSETEYLFGFSFGGTEAKYANNIAGLVYDVHLLGDYMSDNSEFTGLPEINLLITNIQNILRNLDEYESAAFRKKIEKIKESPKESKFKADELMSLLIQNVPLIIKNARKGFLKRKFESKGFVFEKTY